MTERRPTLCVVAGPNGSAISFVDRAYIYDNSIDNQLPRLLYRTTEGQLFKQYTHDIPEWARMLLSNRM